MGEYIHLIKESAALFSNSPLEGESNRFFNDSVGGEVVRLSPHGFSQEKIPLPLKGGANNKKLSHFKLKQR